jgi:hypothetical protein
MSNIEKLTKTLDMVSARQAEVTTSEMRIRGMSNIDSIMPAFGPSWMQFADLGIKRINEKDCPVYTVSAEQFSAYLTAKREFATK